MKLIDYFERAYVVNLPERKDRLRNIQRELEKVEMPLGSDKVKLFSAIKPDAAEPFKSIGQKGCFLSHYTILKEAKDNNFKNVLIMEDDLRISQDFSHHSEAIINQLKQNDWAFVYFGHQLEQGMITAQKPSLEPYIGGIKTTHFYAVNGKITKRLVAFLEQIQQRPTGHPEGGPMHIDGAFSIFRRQNPDLLTLVAVPNLGWQRSSRSDIATLKWFDKIPGLKTIINQARRLKP